MIEKVKLKFKKLVHHEYFLAFMIIFLTGLVMFGIEAFSNGFTLPLNGDYTLQTYTFYSEGYYKTWEFLKTGKLQLFDYSIVLGANYLGSQSFYYVFSPLFYLLLLCPASLLYQGIFVHMVLKYAIGGMFFYILLRKYFKISFKIALIGGIIYAFSGYSLFYLWFHFSDVIAMFPLILIGIERLLQKRKGGVLTISLFLMGLTNYFFLFTFSILGVLYALYRWIYIYGINNKRGYSAQERWSVLLQGILFYGLGIFCSGLVLIPSYLMVAQSSRLSQINDSNIFSSYQLLKHFFTYSDGERGALLSFKNMFASQNIKDLIKYIFVWPERGLGTQTVPRWQSTGYIISQFFFMNTDCWSSTLFTNVSLDNLIGGLFITTPMTVLLIPSIWRGFKSKRPWTIFGIIFAVAMPFIPFNFYLFHGFTGLYGRWLLFIVAISLIFILSTLDKFNEVDKPALTISLIVMITLGIIFVNLSRDYGKLNDEKYYIILGEMVFMGLVWAVYRFKIFKPKYLINVVGVLVVAELFVSTSVTMQRHGFSNWDNYFYSSAGFQEQKQIIKDIKANDDDFYRIYNDASTRNYVNLASTLNYNGTNSFSSTFNPNTTRFFDRSTMSYTGGWNYAYHEKRLFFDQYTGIKYYIVDKLDDNHDGRRNNDDPYQGRIDDLTEAQEYNLNLPIGLEIYKEYSYYDVYKQNNFIHLGSSFDTYTRSGVSGAHAYEKLYSDTVILDNFEDEEELNEYIAKRGYYLQDYETYRESAFDKYISVRQDCAIAVKNKWSRCVAYANEAMNYSRQTEAVSAINTTTTKLNRPENQNFFNGRQSYTYNGKTRYFHGDQLIFELAADKKICPLATTDNKCYLNVPFRMGPQVVISLYNGDALVTQDAHQVHGYSISNANYERKIQRGFYVDQPISKIVVEFIYDSNFEKVFWGTSMAAFDVTTIYEEKINEIYERLNTYAVQNVVVNTNSYEFTTNYDEYRLIALNIPYDDGWKLKINGENSKIYKVNGGMIGILAPTGEVSYTLSYVTPGLEDGITLTTLGFGMLILLMFIYSLSDKKKQIIVYADYDYRKILRGKE